MRDCLGEQATLPKIMPRYSRVDEESWVQLWVENDSGAMLVCHARLCELPDRTLLDTVEAGKGFEQAAAAGGGVTRRRIPAEPWPGGAGLGIATPRRACECRRTR